MQGNDTVIDFEVGVDHLQIDPGLLGGFGGSEASLEQYVRLVPSGTGVDSTLQVDVDSASGGAGWTNLATINGAGSLNALALYRVGDLAIDGRSHDSFDEAKYVASNPDLQTAFGTDYQAGTTHYLTNGFAQGRSAPVDGLQYIASYADLIGAFGANADAGSNHYEQFGRTEGRNPDNFNELQYLNNYSDLQAAFGADYRAATQHFISYGAAEGRTDQPLPDMNDFLL